MNEATDSNSVPPTISMNKKYLSIIIISFLLVSGIYFYNIGIFNTPNIFNVFRIVTTTKHKVSEKEASSEKICPKPQYISPYCPKVMTKAKNIKTGKIKEFSDACLPLCWQAIK